MCVWKSTAATSVFQVITVQKTSISKGLFLSEVQFKVKRCQFVCLPVEIHTVLGILGFHYGHWLSRQQSKNNSVPLGGASQLNYSPGTVLPRSSLSLREFRHLAHRTPLCRCPNLNSHPICLEGFKAWYYGTFWERQSFILLRLISSKIQLGPHLGRTNILYAKGVCACSSPILHVCDRIYYLIERL